MRLRHELTTIRKQYESLQMAMSDAVTRELAEKQARQHVWEPVVRVSVHLVKYPVTVLSLRMTVME